MSYIQKNKTKILLRGGICLGIALDALSKELAFRYIISADRIVPMLNPWASRSLMLALPIILTISFLAVAFLLWCYQTHRITLRSAIFLLAGAVGNLYDRLVFGAVRDWIALPRFPVFNLADVFLTIGVIILIVHYRKRSYMK